MMDMQSLPPAQSLLSSAHFKDLSVFVKELKGLRVNPGHIRR